MTCFQPVSTAADRVMATLVAGLEIEFGRDVGEALAHRFLDAEEVDFLWDARIEELWIGGYEGASDDDLELDRVRILGWLDGRWFVAVMIVDGDGWPHGLMGKRDFSSVSRARMAFANA